MSVAKSINPHISFLLARPSVMKNLSKTQVPKYSSKFNSGSGEAAMLFVVVEVCAGWYVLYVLCCGCWCCAGCGCTYGWADACVCGVGWGACALCLVAVVLVALVLCIPLVVLALSVPLVLCVQPSDVWESDLSFLWGLLSFWTGEGADEVAAVVLCCVVFPATWVVFVATPALVCGFLFSNSLTTISLILVHNSGCLRNCSNSMRTNSCNCFSVTFLAGNKLRKPRNMLFFCVPFLQQNILVIERIMCFMWK